MNKSMRFHPEQVPVDPTPGLVPAVETHAPRHLSSEELLRGGRELLIQHHEIVYHLRLTRNDKLILTK